MFVAMKVFVTNEIKFKYSFDDVRPFPHVVDEFNKLAKYLILLLGLHYHLNPAFSVSSYRSNKSAAMDSFLRSFKIKIPTT